jgi:hypothetical protein
MTRTGASTRGVAVTTSSEPERSHAAPPLVCVECGLESPPDAAGWRANLDDGAAMMFCPECAAREFDADG